MWIQSYKFTNSKSLLKYIIQEIIEEDNQFKKLCVINKILVYFILQLKIIFVIVWNSMKLISIILGMYYYCYYEISTAVVDKQ